MDNEEIISIISNIFSKEYDFLNNIYGITSYKNGIEYLNNNDSNIEQKTKNRILG